MNATGRAEQAALWVARMDRGDWSSDDEARLQRWISEDALNAGALLQAQAAWAATDVSLMSAAAGDAPAPRSGFSRRQFAAFGGGAIAASLVGAFLWAGLPTSYTTGVGEIRRVPLADGSIATINTASKVEVNIAEASRAIRLDEGEAWFQVVKDTSRPFVVEAGRVRVRAVGTAFSVRRRDNGADILVTEGVVETWVEGAEGHRIRLEAGARAFVTDNAAISREPAGPSSVDRALAWRAGKIDLLGDRLDHAVAEFNRYNRRQIVIVDPALAAERFDGVFGTDDPAGFAKALGSSLDVPVDMSEATEIRIGQPRK